MIEINNLTTSKIDKEFVKGVVKRVLKEENKKENKKELDLSIVFVGEARIRKFNKKYRGKNRVTDVLSFGNDLNEIVICLREIKKNAKRYKSTFKKELIRVLTHGVKNILCQSHT